MAHELLRVGAWITLAAALLGPGAGCDLDRLFSSKPDPARDTGGRHVRRRKPPPPSQAPPSEVSHEAPAGVPSVHLALGTPTRADASNDYLIIRPQYALSYNRARLGPNWLSWQLDASYLGGEHRHQGKFLTDESLPAGWDRAQHDDYTGSGYDRGHMVRSEERSRSREDNDATFLLTNVLPQRHDLNAGPWLRLEEYCHTLAQREGRELYLTAGPIYGAQPATIGHGISVPEAFFKIVVVLDRGQGAADVRDTTRVIAVIMPNAEGILGNPWGMYRTSEAEIERRTSYQFLDRVPEAVRRALDVQVDSGPTG